MIIVNRIEEHEKHKASLLAKIDTIKAIPGTSVMPGVYSDWDLPEDIKREYLDEFYDLIDPVMESIAESLGFLAPKYLIRDYRMGITKIWFNQYSEGGEHDWHNHPGCQLLTAITWNYLMSNIVQMLLVPMVKSVKFMQQKAM